MFECEICGLKSDRNYKGKELCEYHYWLVKGKPQDDYWAYRWKEYRYLHPVRVSHWKKKDSELDRFLEGQ